MLEDLTRRDFLKTVAIGSAAGMSGLLSGIAPAADGIRGTTPARSSPTISLPKGGGAIKGIGETFKADLFTGTANFSVPIATSPGRDGFGPQLSLQYSSGNGNGPFGVGWQLSVPRITRKTEKAIPRYRDNEPGDGDTFVLSGAEDLVPSLDENGKPIKTTRGSYTIRQFRPRTEGLFARIEMWAGNGNIFWRVTTRDNISNLYGRTKDARIANPANENQVFEWLLEETFDGKGNHIHYEYIIDLNEQTNTEAPRRFTQAYLRRILYGNVPVDYKNASRPRRHGYSVDNLETRGQWAYLFEVLFDYGDIPRIPPIAPKPDDWTWPKQAELRPGNDWVPRKDSFSSYRASFEIRTRFLCQRVLMLHHFEDPELSGAPLVKSADFEYSNDTSTQLSLLKSVTLSGYRKFETSGTIAYKTASLPSLEFKYSAFEPTKQRFKPLVSDSGSPLPPSLKNPNTALLDLSGNGLPDIVTPYDYWQNRGQGEFVRRAHKAFPAEVAFGQAGVVTGDMGGDGLPDIIVLRNGSSGFYEARADGGWLNFRPFRGGPSFSLEDPNVRLVDLTGDGRPDVLRTEDRSFVFFPCRGEEGYAAPEYLLREHNLATFPDVYFSDQRVRLADMTGDGLHDIVLVHSGRIEYWPSLGYGKYGACVVMAHAPHFGSTFDPKRLFLVDLNGNGCSDLVYVENDHVDFWFNLSGNGWSDKQTISGTPPVDNFTALEFADLLGVGTTSLVWSRDLTNGGSNYRLLDFCGGTKPFLLTEMSNGMGATTRVRYGTSTAEAIRDRNDGRPWVTSLPFPVQIVKAVEVLDHISNTKLVTEYRYHHGYYSGRDREFRGFAAVEQVDTQKFDDFAGAGLHDNSQPLKNVLKGFHVPPVRIRTWFHTGLYFDEHVLSANGAPFDAIDLSSALRSEFYQTDPDAKLLDSHIVATADTPHDGFRGLRGSALRTEVYAEDKSDKAIHPYSVTENRYEVIRLQGGFEGNPPVYHTVKRETVSYQYERNPADPRIKHEINLEFDKYGNVTRELAIAYGRRTSASEGSRGKPETPTTADNDGKILTDEDMKKQRQVVITYTENRFTNAIMTDHHYRTPIKCESKTYELTGFELQNQQDRFSLDEWTRDSFASLTASADIPYEETATVGKKQKRLIEHVRTLFRPDDCGASQKDNPLTLLPLERIDPLALTGETYKLAFTPGLLNQVFRRARQPLLADFATVPGGVGADQGGYVKSQDAKLNKRFPDSDPDDHWWLPSGRVFLSPKEKDTASQELAYARSHFFLPHRYRDPFHSDASNTETFVTYDPDDLLILETRDALDNRVTVGTRDGSGNLRDAGNNYRVLQPGSVTDPNGDRTKVSFDALGMVVATAVMGRDGENLGDELKGFDPDPALVELLSFLGDPQSRAASLLGKATTRFVYDVHAYRRVGQPPFAATLARETHFHDKGGGQTKIQVSFSYSDGFGREIQKKIQVKAGAAAERNPIASLPTGDHRPGDLVRVAGSLRQKQIATRWVGTGRTVYNNKGKPVKKYEPFFSPTHLYESESEMTDSGVTSILFYDPVERVIAMLHPDHSYEKVVFDPWRQRTFDANDTVSLDPQMDPDVIGYLSLYLAELSEQNKDWRTWLGQRGVDPQHPPADSPSLEPQKKAAVRALLHAETPTVAYLDSLGRIFLTIAHNRFKYTDRPASEAPIEQYNCTRVRFDVEGNQREVVDAQDRIVMRYEYDLLGNLIHQTSMEAGERWMLNDVTGNPIRTWDGRAYTRRMTYDVLRRPVSLFVMENGVEREAERTVYGESQGDRKRHRTRIHKICDGTGVVTNVEYDFKGNLIESRRELLSGYKKAVDWQQNPPANYGTFTTFTKYDALNRPVVVTTPDGSVYRPQFDEANSLKKLEINLRGDPSSTPFVAEIDYNARGQRKRIAYVNGMESTYDYDPLTFRLTQLKTKRRPGLNGVSSQIFANSDTVQDLHYTHDPVGNIVRIEDAALKLVIYDNKEVKPTCEYRYDAIYRLIEAEGREHIGQTAFNLRPSNGSYGDYPFAGLEDFTAHPNDLQTLRNYTERYQYDAVGNFERIMHRIDNGGWIRVYVYDEASLIEDGLDGRVRKPSNRLSRTDLQPERSQPVREPYTYDAHGNTIRMPHLGGPVSGPNMYWDFKDQLRQADLGGGGMAYYVYDSTGQRVRKVIELQSGKRHERIYLGNYEIYREYESNDTGPRLERQSLHIMDDKQRIALVETLMRENSKPTEAAPVHRYQFVDHLGSACLELAEDGAFVSYESYHPYGTSSFRAGRTAAEVSTKRYRYASKERGEESGFYYHGARYYLPWLGRWTSCDPVGIADSENLYAYVRGNPLMNRDPKGTRSEPVLQTIDVSAVTPREEAQQWSLPEEHSSERETQQDFTTEEHNALSTSPESDKWELSAVSNQEITRQKTEGVLNLTLPPQQAFNDWESTIDPVGYFSYSILYGLNQSLYAPMQEWLSPSPRHIVNTEGRVAEYTGPRDNTAALGAMVQLGLLFAPTPKTAAAGEAFVTTTNSRMQTLANAAESGQIRWVAGDKQLYEAYTAAVTAARNNVATGRHAFNLLRKRMETQIDLNGVVHHWRYPIHQYTAEATAAENLYLIESIQANLARDLHLEIHRAIGIQGAPYRSMRWGQQRELQSMFNFWSSNQRLDDVARALGFGR
jgi:RHS repeat-associated protein